MGADEVREEERWIVRTHVEKGTVDQGPYDYVTAVEAVKEAARSGVWVTARKFYLNRDIIYIELIDRAGTEVR